MSPWVFAIDVNNISARLDRCGEIEAFVDLGPVPAEDFGRLRRCQLNRSSAPWPLLAGTA